MPIDDALGELQVPEGGKPREQESEKTPEVLIANAREVMGTFLISFFNGELPGQSRIAVPQEYLPIIKYLGFDLLKIIPQRGTQGPQRSNELSLTIDMKRMLPGELKRKVLQEVCGDQVFETDLAGLVDAETVDPLFNNVPELESFRVWVTEERTPGFKRDLAVLHPYIFVLGMSYQDRPLATMATKRAFDERKRDMGEFIGKRMSEQFFPSRELEGILERLRTPTACFVSSAREYGLKEVQRAIRSFGEVCAHYLKSWRAN